MKAKAPKRHAVLPWTMTESLESYGTKTTRTNGWIIQDAKGRHICRVREQVDAINIVASVNRNQGID